MTILDSENNQINDTLKKYLETNSNEQFNTQPNNQVDGQPSEQFDNKLNTQFNNITQKQTVSKTYSEETDQPSYTEILKAYNSRYMLSGLLINKSEDVALSIVGEYETRNDPKKNFNPITEESIRGIPVQYRRRLAEAETDVDVAIIRKKIFQEMEDDDILERASWWKTALVAAPAEFAEGLALAPAAIPYKIIKYASVFPAFAKNVLRALPRLFAYTGTRNAAIISNKETKGLNDWMFDTLFETGVGSLMEGIPGVLKLKEYTRGRLGFKALYEDLDFTLVTNNKGHITGLKVEGEIASKVKEVQALVDSGIASMGEKKFFKFVYGMSPLVKGMTNDFPIVRKAFGEMFGHNWVTTAMEHPALKAINTRIHAVNELIKDSSNPADILNYKKELKSLNKQRKVAKKETGNYGDQTIVNNKINEVNERITASQKRKELLLKINDLKNKIKKTSTDADSNLHPTERLKNIPNIRENLNTQIAAAKSAGNKQLATQLRASLKQLAADKANIKNEIKSYGGTKKIKQFKNMQEIFQSQLENIKNSEWKDLQEKIKSYGGRKELRAYENIPLLKPEKITSSRQQSFAASVIAQQYKNKQILCDIATKQFWYDHIGLGTTGKTLPFSDTTAKVKNVFQKNPNYMSFSDFDRAVGLALRRGEQSPIAKAAEAAKLYRDEIYDPFLKELKELKIFPDDIGVDTAMSYLNRMYNKNLITARRPAFVKKLINYYAARDKKIKELNAPIASLEKELKKESKSLEKNILKAESLEEAGSSNSKIRDDILSKQSYIEQLKQNLLNEQTQLQKKLEERKIYLSPEDIDNGLTQESLLTPGSNITQTLIDEHSLLTKELMQTKEKSIAAKSQLTKTKEQLAKARKNNASSEEIKKIKDQINIDSENIRTSQKEIEIHQEKINEKIKNKTVSKQLYYTNKLGKDVLIDVEKSKLTKLGTLYGKENYANIAEQTTKTILAENEEQMAERIFNGLRTGGTNPLEARTVLCSDYYLEDFFVNDASYVAAAHTNNLANYIALEKFFRRFGTTTELGKEKLINDLISDYELLYNQIIQNTPEGAERDKKLLNLSKKKEKAEALLTDGLSILTDRYGMAQNEDARTIQEWLKFGKSYSFASMMGGVSFMFLQDLFMPMKRYGFKHIVDGVYPAVNRLLHLKLPREAWGDMSVGINTIYAAYTRRQVWGKDTQFLSQTKKSRWFSNLTKVAGNAFLINQTCDLAEGAAAATASSAMIRDLTKWKSKGKYVGIEKNKVWVSEYQFSQKELENFQVGRLNFQKYGERILEMFKEYGKEEYGGFVPNTHKWTDVAAGNHFEKYINTSVNHLVNKVGKSDSPYWFKHPAAMLGTQFLSWGFGAANNMQIPILQRPDQEKMFHFVISTITGMLVPIFRQLASGREVETDKRTLIIEGLLQSGYVPPIVDYMIKVNSVIDPKQTRWLQSDRWRGKNVADLLAGPLGSIGNNVARTARMISEGEFNKQDVAGFVKSFPLANAPYFRKPFADWLESSNMRKRSRKKMYGEKAEKPWE
jgi:hypothetical protein